MEQIRKFTIEFFENLKCDISKKEDILIIRQVPKIFEDLFGKAAPYQLSFVPGIENTEFVGKGSRILEAMRKFLKGAGKTTLLKIDFDCDAEAEIKKRLSLKNCEIKSLKRSYRNNFFVRFSFVTSFNYLNESERVVSKVYVHEGEVVEGDLDGYNIREKLEDRKQMTEKEMTFVKRDYRVAKEVLSDVLKEKTEEIRVSLKKKIDIEIERIRGHYDKQLREFGGDLNGKLEKMRELELELRVAEEREIEVLRGRLERLRMKLVKAGEDEAVRRILKEREFTIRDAMQKFSLNIDRKLVNTTVIYYPVFSFRLYLKSEIGEKVERLIEMTYDPLKKSLSRLECEGCGSEIVQLSLCSGGHISCGECLESCGECGKKFCVKCLQRSCASCGRKLCRDCAVMCMGCGRYVCKTHMRRDCVSGDDRCVLCLRACLRCHGMSEEKFFGEARDGSKVCQKCLGIEKRGKVMERIFRK